jgi:cytochrome P450
MRDFDTVDYFMEPSLVDDPFPYFEHLRAKCPVTPLPHHGVVAVTGYDAASEAWRDHETFSSCNAVTGPFPGLPVKPEGDDIRALIEEHRGGLPMGEYLITADPPSHTALRGLLMRLLTPKRLQENEAFMWRLADLQIDHAFRRGGSFEVLSDLAQPYALLVIADLLGVPEEDRRSFTAQLGVEHPEPGVGDHEHKVTLDPLSFLVETFTAYVEDRRRAPRNDVLTHLATATFPDGSTPPVIDVVRTATFLFAAGQDTTARLITAALQVIGDDPEVQALLRRERGRIPDFLEEVLRLSGPVKTVSRMARVRTTLGGVDIPAGTTLAIFPHAANRDPDRFEAPNEMRLDRENVREHLAFGRGIHSCPGGPLARVEARVALERLFDRTDDIRVSEAAHGPAGARRYEYVPTYILRGVKELHVEVTPNGGAR